MRALSLSRFSVSMVMSVAAPRTRERSVAGESSNMGPVETPFFGIGELEDILGLVKFGCAFPCAGVELRADEGGVEVENPRADEEGEL